MNKEHTPVNYLKSSEVYARGLFQGEKSGNCLGGVYIAVAGNMRGELTRSHIREARSQMAYARTGKPAWCCSFVLFYMLWQSLLQKRYPARRKLEQDISQREGNNQPKRPTLCLHFLSNLLLGAKHVFSVMKLITSCCNVYCQSYVNYCFAKKTANRTTHCFLYCSM